jgi:hypothetical protein
MPVRTRDQSRIAASENTRNVLGKKECRLNLGNQSKEIYEKYISGILCSPMANLAEALARRSPDQSGEFASLQAWLSKELLARQPADIALDVTGIRKIECVGVRGLLV